MEPLLIVFIAVGVLVALAVAYTSHTARLERLAELARLADSLGWQFDPDSRYSPEDEYSHFRIFRTGHSRYAYNTLSGSCEVGGRSCPAQMGDFHYQTTSSDGDKTTTHTHRFSYYLLRLPYQQLPSMNIRREGLFDAIKGALGFDDIDFESAEFSKRFYVTSSQKRFAYDVIHPAMMEFLLASGTPTIAIEEGYCCLSDGHHTWTPEEFEAISEWAHRFFLLWPKHLTSTLEPR